MPILFACRSLPSPLRAIPGRVFKITRNFGMDEEGVREKTNLASGGELSRISWKIDTEGRIVFFVYFRYYYRVIFPCRSFHRI